MDCALCPADITDTAVCCHRCATTTQQRLRAAAQLLPELAVTITRQTRMADPAPRTGRLAPAAPIRPGGDPADDHQHGWPTGLPYDAAAAEVLDAVRNTVTTWARVIADATGADPPADPDDLTRWVAGRTDWLRYETYGAEALDELAYAARLIEGAVDRPAARVYLGPCMEPDGLSGACPGELYAHRGAAQAVCRQCGTGHPVDERKRWLDGLVREHAYTASEIAGAYPHIPASTIRRWASATERRILAVSQDRHGRPMYRLADVLKLADRRRQTA